MPWYWQFLVSVGQWAQAHQALTLTLTLSLAIVVCCGAARLPWRTFFTARRPRL
jgi:hypothetical protein